MALWTNLLKQSANLDDSASPWADNTSFTITEAPSVIPGQKAWSHQNDGGGARLRRQSAGVFTSSPETFVLLVKNVDASVTRFGLLNATEGGTSVALAEFDWSTLAVSNIGGDATDRTAFAHERGDGLWLVGVTYTSVDPGDTRRIAIYPTGAGTNTLAATLHYAGLHEADTFSPVYLVNGDTLPEHRVIDLSEFKVSARPAQTSTNLTHQRRRASGKLSTTLHSDAVRRRRWSLQTEIDDRATGEALQDDLDEPGTIQLLHNPLIHPVTGVAVECEAEVVGREDGPLEDHVRLAFEAVEVAPARDSAGGIHLLTESGDIIIAEDGAILVWP